MINYKHNPKLTSNAKELRKEMTEEERKLWYKFLKNLPIRFLRQKVIDEYIVDFYCSKAKLVIEVDGTQHYLDEGKKRDCVRDKNLRARGLKVLRFANNQINFEFEAVCECIYREIEELIKN